MRRHLSLSLLALALSACQQAEPPAAPASAATETAAPAAQSAPAGQVTGPEISAEDFAQHVRVLSSDEFGGRAPGTPGETLTISATGTLSSKDAGDYTGCLQALAALKVPVDTFFDRVMVNAEDPHLRANRLALLAALHAAMNRVADLSRLAA